MGQPRPGSGPSSTHRWSPVRGRTWWQCRCGSPGEESEAVLDRPTTPTAENPPPRTGDDAVEHSERAHRVPDHPGTRLRLDVAGASAGGRLADPDRCRVH